MAKGLGPLLGFTDVVIIGWMILLVDCIGIMYRIVTGWLNLYDNKPMYAVPLGAIGARWAAVPGPVNLPGPLRTSTAGPIHGWVKLV